MLYTDIKYTRRKAFNGNPKLSLPESHDLKKLLNESAAMVVSMIVCSSGKKILSYTQRLANVPSLQSTTAEKE